MKTHTPWLWMGLSSLIFTACYTPPSLSYDTLCAQEDVECLARDHDGDGVSNGEDDFPFDPRCSELNNDNCEACGVGCEAPLVCLSAERRCADAPQLDQGVFDMMSTDPRDQALPDMELPDMALPDMALPDMALPDMALPDMALPDMALPDMALPDMEPTCQPTDNVDDDNCDNIDDDCDGRPDEGFISMNNTSCGTGACERQGVIFCTNTGIDEICMEGQPLNTTDHTCDGIDDDCDGSSDEGYVSTESSCGVGFCSNRGTLSCNSSGEVEDSCQALDPLSALDDTCDGVDDDCDGQNDEDVESDNINCGQGVCVAAGTRACVNGVLEDLCTPTPPISLQDLTCDRVDDDCDGQFDEDGDCPPCAFFRDGCPELGFVSLTGGSFSMGSLSEPVSQPIREVTLQPFEVMRAELTVAQYRPCVQSNVCRELLGAGCNWTTLPEENENQPMNCLSWDAAMVYAAWAGVRLLTESEWEYAARGGRTEQDTFPWGDAPASCLLADYGSLNCGSGTSEVCSHPTGNTSNNLCDMAGNVAEWVQDEFFESYTNAPNNGAGMCTGACPDNADHINFDRGVITRRVIRGGGWNSLVLELRTSYRNRLSSEEIRNDVGVRFAR